MANLLEYFKSLPEVFIVNEDDGGRDLYAIKYIHGGIDWSLPWALDARGLVINGDIISRPYRKFFNMNELDYREDLDESVKKLAHWSEGPYTVAEKLDGSLMIVSWYAAGDELLVTSSGSITNSYSTRFKNWLVNNLSEDQMWALQQVAEDYTLIFEYTAPNNQIVIPYKEVKVTLHGMVETATAHEIHNRDILQVIANNIGIDLVKSYDMTLDEIIKFQEEGSGIEGFVVTFENGRKLKFKTAAYVEAHISSSIYFGRATTRRKINLLVDLAVGDAIDDLIAEAARRENDTLVQVAESARKHKLEFDKLVINAHRIANLNIFDSRKYVMRHGTKSLDSKLVLMFASGKLDRIYDMLQAYVLEKVKADFANEIAEYTEEEEEE